MPRSVRIEYPGAFYHVMARGNLRGRIFFDDDDRRFFLEALGEACGKTGWRIHAWVLMGNHYHLFVETPQGNLVAGMRWLQNTVTRRFNVRHRQWGRVFGDRYKSVLVEGHQAGYYETLWDYIHLNPVRGGLIRPEKGQSVLDYPWSSVAGGYALPRGRRAKWLAVEEGLAILGVDDSVAGRRKLVERLNRRAVEEGRRSGMVPLPAEVDARMSHLRRGWYWGSQEFGERMLKLGSKAIGKGKSRAYSGSRERRAHDALRAEEWIREGLKSGGLEEAELEELKGNDARKVALGKLVWEKTTVSQGWIAQRLMMASAANVSQVLRRTSWKELRRTIPKEMLAFLEGEAMK